jgi:Tfp pilus assembly protein PilV
MNTFFKLVDNRSSMRGFTLIETLVSTFIITMVILGPLTLASRASAYARITKDTLIATYLAQESIELIRHQQDSVYIRCIQEAGTTCVPTGTESIPDAAWRTFRDRFNSVSGTSCFAAENANGCSYDFIDMTTNEDTTPSKYISTAAFCGTLSLQSTTNLYMCTGRASGAGYSLTKFSRSVSITSIPTLSGAEQNYNDDLRVTVTVSFRRANGYLNQVKVIDFLHALP